MRAEFTTVSTNLRDGASTPIVRAEDQGIGLATMLLGFGVEAVPEEVLPSLQDGYVARHVIGYQATLETGWIFLASNQNPALMKLIDFANMHL